MNFYTSVPSIAVYRGIMFVCLPVHHIQTEYKTGSILVVKEQANYDLTFHPSHFWEGNISGTP